MIDFLQTPIPFKNFDPVVWQRNWNEPNWDGRDHIITEEDVVDYLDRESKLIQIEKKTPHGWKRYVSIIDKTLDGQDIVLYALAQDIYTGSPGTTINNILSNQGWNNNNNTVECIGGGGSGAAAQISSTAKATGGGSGAYSRISNYNMTPGSTQFLIHVGAGGTAANVSQGSTAFVNGVAGGATWFGPTTQTTDPGVGTDNTKCSAAGGGAGQGSITAGSTLVGGTGGAISASWGQTKYAGGAGGAISTGTYYSATGGGATGVTGTGGAGVAASGTGQATNGGDATGDSAGLGGIGFTSGNGGAGGNGSNSSTNDTTLPPTPPPAGGGGGSANWAQNLTTTGGSGGLYGAGGGANLNIKSSPNNSVIASSGVGAQGIVVLTWLPTAKNFGFIIG